MSVEHSSRPSAIGTSAFGYDGSRGEGTNNGSDLGNDKGDVRQQQQSGQPLAFTCEDDFTHCIKMKTTALEEPVQVLEPLESHIKEDNKG